jgi:DnaD/phage-associated family protein
MQGVIIMPQRNFDDAFWGDDFVQSLEPESKLLFAYLWTNKSCNAAGLYQITIKSITFETGLPQEQLKSIFLTLESKVKWYPEQNIVWVKNFVKHQAKSPQFLIAVAKCLNSFNDAIIREFLEYNKLVGISIPYEYSTHTVSIPYPYRKNTLVGEPSNGEKPYPIDTLSIPPYANADADNNINIKDMGVLGGGKDTIDVIVKIYESNIGIVTPMIAEELKDMASYYPKGWFEEAVREACKYNGRNLKYVSKILVNWETKGFKNSSVGKKQLKGNENDQNNRYKRTN